MDFIIMFFLVGAIIAGMVSENGLKMTNMHQVSEGKITCEIIKQQTEELENMHNSIMKCRLSENPGILKKMQENMQETHDKEQNFAKLQE